MKVVLSTRAGKRGEITLDENGVAVGSNARTRSLMNGTRITEPDTFKRLEPKDGERYLRALPDNLSGAYVVADFVE
jgi:hypothetical protein